MLRSISWTALWTVPSPFAFSRLIRRPNLAHRRRCDPAVARADRPLALACQHAGQFHRHCLGRPRRLAVKGQPPLVHPEAPRHARVNGLERHCAPRQADVDVLFLPRSPRRQFRLDLAGKPLRTNDVRTGVHRLDRLLVPSRDARLDVAAIGLSRRPPRPELAQNVARLDEPLRVRGVQIAAITAPAVRSEPLEPLAHRQSRARLDSDRVEMNVARDLPQVTVAFD